MKKALFTILFITVLVTVITNAQVFNSNDGDVLPNTGTIRVLYVFAELDCSTCPPLLPNQPSNFYCKGSATSNWPEGSIPQGLDDYIDADISNNPQGKITKYYKEVSFGGLNILGDYYDQILSVPCDMIGGNGAGVNIVMERLNEEFASGNPNFQTTHSGKTLIDFDLVQGEGNHFIEKNTNNGNTVIDAIAIVWRNNNRINYQSCGAGFALQTWGLTINDALDQGDGFLFRPFLVGSWSDCNGTGNLFIQEFAHTLFGGNHWHASGGAGRHTFPFTPSVISINGQSSATSISACGWDRMFTGWNNPLFHDPFPPFPIPVIDENLNCISGDLTTPINQEQIFILRDHVTTGGCYKD